MANAGDGGLLPQLRLDDLLSELQARLEAVLSTRDRMHGLLEAVVAVGSGLELEAMLRRIVEAAVDLVDARYGALGVIGEDQQLIEFIPVGLDAKEISEIHHWPEGRGLLGLLIKEPRPLRLADIGAHQESSGFQSARPSPPRRRWRSSSLTAGPTPSGCRCSRTGTGSPGTCTTW